MSIPIRNSNENAHVRFITLKNKLYSYETCMSLPLTQRNEYKLMQASSPLKKIIY